MPRLTMSTIADESFCGELSAIRKVLDAVQKQTDPQDKLIAKLTEVYNATDEGVFITDMLSALTIVLKTPRLPRAEHFIRLLDFYAAFITKLHNNYQASRNNESNTSSDLDSSSDSETPMHPLLAAAFDFIFLHHETGLVDARYNVTVFANKLISAFGPDTELPQDTWDQIQDTFLHRLKDVKTFIRIEAIKVLFRVQNPFDEHDAVSIALKQCLKDNNPKVRAEVIKSIGPSTYNFKALLEHLRDENTECRLTLYKQINMSAKVTVISIENRCKILMAGLHDHDPEVLKYVSDTILMSWLEMYDFDYMRFFKALKLDAGMEDLNNFEKLMKKIMRIFIKKFTMKELIKALNLDETTKTVQFNNLSMEKVIYWTIIADKLHEKDVYNENVSLVLPEVLDFVTYIETFTEKNLDQAKDKSIIDILHYQYMLGQLISIFLYYTLDDPIQKSRVQNLLKKVLIKMDLSVETIDLITEVYYHLVPKNIEFLDEYFEIMTYIRYSKPEPVVEISPDEIRRQEIRKADLVFQMNMLKADIDVAVSVQNFIKAELLKNQINAVTAELEKLNVQNETTNIDDDGSNSDVSMDGDDEKYDTNDPAVVDKYAIVISACLKVIQPKKDNASVDAKLSQIREKLVKDMDKFKADSETVINILHCFGLTLYFHVDTATKFLPILLLPIFYVILTKVFKKNSKIKISTYSSPIVNKGYLKESIFLLTDLMLLFKVSVFDTPYNSIASIMPQQSQLNDTSNASDPIMTVRQFIETLKDLLDNLDEDLRLAAAETLVRLLNCNCIQSGTLLALLIIKWFNPVSSDDNRLRQMISCLLTNLKSVECGADLIKSAFPITLKLIHDAPVNSPLAQIQITYVIKFLAELSCSKFFANVNTTIHRDIVLDLLNTIKKNITGKCNVVFTKALLYLELPYDDVEYMNLIENLSHEIKFENQSESANPNMLRNLDMFLELIRSQTATNHNDDESESNDENH